MRLPTDILRGLTPLLVLEALADDHLAGREILARIRERGNGLEIAEGTIYPLLYRLEAKRWLSASWSTGEGVRSQRCYQVTDAGHKARLEQRKRWREVAGVLKPLLGGGE
ncbi:MAG: helix-turn-helix transcriptional regulator [Planctomycetes bacterium]|nr:helix-turn-helix transcriptional regulator [Planctomycetota bacterium]